MKPTFLKSTSTGKHKSLQIFYSRNKSKSLNVNNLFMLTIVLLFSMNFTSCRSTRDMKYFQDVQNETQQDKSSTVPEYLIKADDNLYVDIKSMNVEVNQLFSPSKTASYGGGTQSDFGLVSSQYLNGYRVDQKGIIQLPVIGEVKVDGMTEEAANIVIQKRVNEYFKDATVRVKILTYKITVLGEVRNPGVYYNYDKSITVLDALGLANGTTEYASIKKVLVLRTTASGKKSYRLDLREKSFMSSEAFYLIPNDILYIEPDNYKNSAFNTTVFSLTLAAISTTILILSYIQK